MKKLFTKLFAFFALISCGSGRITTTETRPTETIIFGRLTINSDTPINNERVLIHFNERLLGRNAVRLDENGFFILRMPLGNSFLALVEYLESGGFFRNIPDHYISINAPLSEKIYYIGDISLDWTPSNSDRRRRGGAVGVLGEAAREGETINATVIRSDKTINHFKQLFPDNTKEIVIQLVKIE